MYNYRQGSEGTRVISARENRYKRIVTLCDKIFTTIFGPSSS